MIFIAKSGSESKTGKRRNTNRDTNKDTKVLGLFPEISAGDSPESRQKGREGALKEEVVYKHCEECGRVISDSVNSDYYSYIRKKYCDECQPIVHRRQVNEAKKRYRERHRAIRDSALQCYDSLRAYKNIREEYLQKMNDKIEECRKKIDNLEVPFFDE